MTEDPSIEQEPKKNVTKSETHPILLPAPTKFNTQMNNRLVNLGIEGKGKVNCGLRSGE